MLLLLVSTLSSLITIGLWIRDVIKTSNGKLFRILYPFVFVIISIFSIYQYHQLDQMKAIENEAEKISSNWPEPDRVTFLSKGERFGIIMSGQTFLEKYKDKFPDTYGEFKSLLKGRLGNYEAKHDFDSKYNEYIDLEDVCIATIVMIKNFKPIKG